MKMEKDAVNFTRSRSIRAKWEGIVRLTPAPAGTPQAGCYNGAALSSPRDNSIREQAKAMKRKLLFRTVRDP